MYGRSGSDRPIFWDMKKLLALLVSISILMACTPTTPPVPQPTPLSVPTPTATPMPETESTQWWRDAIFYEIFVRSFSDSNADGIGDFNGVTQKLDYIQQLGVNALWLMPINPSPSYHGYDVTNYYAVNPDYGSMADFKHLLDEAHRRGIRVIIDLVLNHTSSQHPFFVDANSGPGSKYRNWYVWSDTSGGAHWYQGNGGYYYAYFCGCMPDLNYRNPEVTAQMENVVRYWLQDVDIDGFRIDAAKHLIEEGNKLENTQSTHDWFKGFYTFYKAIDTHAYTVGEVASAGAFIATKYKDQMDQIFNFELASGMVNSAGGGSNSSINSAWQFTLQDITDGNYATFLTNHDQNRVMSVLNGNVDKAKLAATILLTAPGTPFIYYGEEIGMQGEKPDENIRLPMQWTAATNAGFTTGMPWRAPNSDFTTVNVVAEEKDPNSLLNLYRSLTTLRSEHTALRTGGLSVLDTGNTGVYAIIRSNNNENILVVANLTKSPISDYALSLSDSVLPDGNFLPASLLDSTQAHSITVSNGTFTDYKPLAELPPYQIYIFQLK